MGTRIQIDSVMRPQSSSRGRNTSASVTVTVTAQSLIQLGQDGYLFLPSLPILIFFLNWPCETCAWCSIRSVSSVLKVWKHL